MNNNKQNNFGVMLLVVVFIGLGIYAWTSLKQPDLTAMEASLTSTYFAEGRPVNNINMIDYDGQAFTEAKFKGKWTFVFFGFTHCPDVCPTSLLIMKNVWSQLPEAARVNSQFIFVSVDPDRDTPEILKGYVKHYNQDFIAITAVHDKLDVLTTQLYALYGYEDTSEKDDGAYNVNHTDKLFLIDPNGTYRAYFSTPYPPKLILSEFEIIQTLFERDGVLALSVDKARIPSAPPTVEVMAGYMSLINNSKDKAIEIVAVSSPDFNAVEMHATVSSDGVSKMIKQKSLIINANESVEFSQGGLHLMLIGPKKSYQVGDSVVIVFKVSTGEIISTRFIIEEASLDQMQDHSHHHHHNH